MERIPNGLRRPDRLYRPFLFNPLHKSLPSFLHLGFRPCFCFLRTYVNGRLVPQIKVIWFRESAPPVIHCPAHRSSRHPACQDLREEQAHIDIVNPPPIENNSSISTISTPTAPVQRRFCLYTHLTGIRLYFGKSRNEYLDTHATWDNYMAWWFSSSLLLSLHNLGLHGQIRFTDKACSRAEAWPHLLHPVVTVDMMHNFKNTALVRL